jgi:Periplasmic serine proteases (ClpP class)
MEPIKCSLIPEALEADVILISARMSRDLHRQLTHLITENKHHERCVLFLTTFGGDPDGAYRIARCLRHNYKDHLRIVVPSFCKSAGTLLVIAADELAIGDLGELGPLDVQVSKPTEIDEVSSCLDIKQALDSIISHSQSAFWNYLTSIKRRGQLSTRIAAEISYQFSAQLFSSLVAQIDPQRLGEMDRANTIAFSYGERLDTYSKSLQSRESLSSLILGYPSHSFVIDRKEAGTLFTNVMCPTDWENDFYQQFAAILDEPREITEFFVYGKDAGDTNENDGGTDNECKKSTEPEVASELSELPDGSN